MRHNYCTVYSKTYLYMGLILYNSLLQYDRDFYLYIFCMDDEAFDIMKSMNLDRIVLINLKDVESEDKELYYSKISRTEKEYSWTIKGSVLLYLFKHFEDMDHIIWLDGDLRFLSDPQPIFDEFSEYSILLTEEKYTDQYEYLSKIYGVYQLGFIGFKRDENSLKCLNWYRERLIEWCSENPLDGKWSDQRYAVDWPVRFKGVGIVKNDGINLTPFIAYRLQQEGKGLIHEHDGDIYLDDTKIIFFHFYGFKFYDGNEYDLCLHWMKFSDSTLKLLYLSYINAAKEAVNKIREISPSYYLDSKKEGKYVRNYFNLEAAQMKDRYFFCTIVDSRSIEKLLALHESLSRFTDNFTWWICCMEDKNHSLLKSINLPNVILMDIKNIESDEFSHVKHACSKEQYRSLIKAGITYSILKNNFSIDKLFYLDPNIYFFSHPSILFESLAEGCIFIYNYREMSEKRTSGVLDSGIIGFVRTAGALYFLEDYIIACVKFRSQNEKLKYKNFNMPLADYYGIKLLVGTAADIDVSLLRFLKIDIKNDKLICLKKELTCFNFGNPKSLSLLSRLLERNRVSFARSQALKRIYQTYIHSLREASQKIRNIF